MRIEFNDESKQIFDCGFCSGRDIEDCDLQQMEIFGCVLPSEGYSWEISPCFICGGTNANCKQCNGSNAIQVYRCPRAMVTDEIKALLPYFLEYFVSKRDTGKMAYPDGGARYDQPTKLRGAFDIMYSELIRETEKQKEKENEHAADNSQTERSRQ